MSGNDYKQTSSSNLVTLTESSPTTITSLQHIHNRANTNNNNNTNTNNNNNNTNNSSSKSNGNSSINQTKHRWSPKTSEQTNVVDHNRMKRRESFNGCGTVSNNKEAKTEQQPTTAAATTTTIELNHFENVNEDVDQKLKREEDETNSITELKEPNNSLNESMLAGGPPPTKRHKLNNNSSIKNCINNVNLIKSDRNETMSYNGPNGAGTGAGSYIMSTKGTGTELYGRTNSNDNDCEEYIDDKDDDSRVLGAIEARFLVSSRVSRGTNKVQTLSFLWTGKLTILFFYFGLSLLGRWCNHWSRWF